MADNSENKVTPASRQYPDPARKLKNDVATTGHSWDGIEEYDNPMPRWWVWIFIITIIWSVGYWIAYPAWPGIKSATAGLLGYSSRANVAAEINEFEARNEGFFVQLVDTDLEDIRDNDELHRFAVNAGAAVFRAQCSQCHGSGGAGVQAAGYPNLLDDDWLWGGTLDDIVTTVTWGIRNEDFADARWSEMPAFGRDGLLDDAEIDQVVNHVLSLSGADHDAQLAAAGAELYEINCASCHGDGGEGDYFLGAPALNNQVWLYGGSFDAIRETVYYSRFGVMPGFENRLREAEIRAVAAYVHQLGGGQ
ncbi:cytochrome-c oxidase, cbb3-type subunit III [Roseinatronobacter alkalisoli]|uniref:Cbb3-type cytochrome c oxidase subunit n=1 Tax=Roseinatronobacter alkalisoli TaxID=3028235 RepID=A0ABT5TAX3_9RHOB|nr:cytochrome-c oxidase, cbb3-type subunit III [Roseinatronobacter sp. HJB301]MDD7972126.1 cytochrome-c oxidase, cbb3-type subunit III [Roseinatronobacter sp. HJB301]